MNEEERYEAFMSALDTLEQHGCVVRNVNNTLEIRGMEKTFPHDGTPEGLSGAFIAAAEEVKSPAQ